MVLYWGERCIRGRISAGVPAYEEYKGLVEKIFGSTSDWQRREHNEETKTICFQIIKEEAESPPPVPMWDMDCGSSGYKVLGLDGDMQLNLSLSLFDEDQVLAFSSDKNLYEGLKRQDDLSDYIVHSEYEGLDLIPSSTLMSSIEYELFTKWQREFILRKCLQKVKESGAYDYILIDAPPTLGGWVMNILCASDEYPGGIPHRGDCSVLGICLRISGGSPPDHTGSETWRYCHSESGYQKKLF